MLRDDQPSCDDRPSCDDQSSHEGRGALVRLARNRFSVIEAEPV
ncbi:hypothetical protein [Streptomyces decoyicus]|nr:hypothetical protein [Streptomyces decoyicus]